MNNPAVSFSAVYKTYPRELGAAPHQALKGISFQLDKGKTLGLVGANGAGKSTTIRLLMDFIRPDKGEILLFDKSPQCHEIRRRIGYLPEIASFPHNLTVLDMIRFTGEACGLPRDVWQKQGEAWLHVLELWEARRRPLRSYSKGMQQRANFVLALINDPDLLILDEPMSGLDPLGRAKIANLIADLKKEGKTILFCSHILEDIDRLSDSILVLHHGEKIFEGLPADLCRQQGVDSMVEGYLKLVQESQPCA